jgi:hypothetical protein
MSAMASAGCAPRPGDIEAVTEVMRSFYDAATRDDLAKFQSLILPGFYAFDGGLRWDGDSLMRAAIKWHDNGDVYVWTVNDPEVHVDCDMAWIAYVNKGSAKKAGDAAPTPMVWLESANFQRDGRSWKLAFFQSTPVRAKAN